MALINEAAKALVADTAFGTLGGQDPWSIYLDLMPDAPSEVVALYPKQDPIRDGVREAAGLHVRIRGVRADEVFDKMDALLGVLAEQPVDGWLAWTDANMGSEGEEDHRRVIALTDIAFYRLCDKVDIERFRRVTTPLSYSYERVGRINDVPALVVTERADRELYRSAYVHSESVQVYVKAGSFSVDDYLFVHTARGRMEVDGNIRRGTGCARNVVHLSGQLRNLP